MDEEKDNVLFYFISRLSSANKIKGSTPPPLAEISDNYAFLISPLNRRFFREW